MTTLTEVIKPFIKEIKEFIMESESYQPGFADYRKAMCLQRITEIKSLVRIIRNTKEHKKEFGTELIDLLDVMSDLEDIVEKIIKKSLEQKDKRKLNEDANDDVEKKKCKFSNVDIHAAVPMEIDQDPLIEETMSENVIDEANEEQHNDDEQADNDKETENAKETDQGPIIEVNDQQHDIFDIMDMSIEILQQHDNKIPDIMDIEVQNNDDEQADNDKETENDKETDQGPIIEVNDQQHDIFDIMDMSIEILQQHDNKIPDIMDIEVQNNDDEQADNDKETENDKETDQGPIIEVNDQQHDIFDIMDMSIEILQQHDNKIPDIMDIEVRNNDDEQEESDYEDDSEEDSDYEDDSEEDSDYDDERARKLESLGPDDEIDGYESEQSELSVSGKTFLTATELRMRKIENRSCHAERTSKLINSYSIPANVTRDEIFGFISTDTKEAQQHIDDFLNVKSKNFDNEIMSSSLQMRKKYFKSFADNYTKNKKGENEGTTKNDQELEKLLKAVDDLRVSAFKDLSKIHGKTSKTKSMHNLLEDVPVTDASTILNDSFYITTPVASCAKYLHTRVAKTEEISDVLIQAHMLNGKEAKIGISQAVCHKTKDGVKFLICKRIEESDEYELISGNNILFVGELETVVKLELSVLEHAYALGISCNNSGDNPMGRKMPSHGISNGLAIVYYAPLKSNAGYLNRFLRRSFPSQYASSMILAIKHQMNDSKLQIGTSLCNYCKKIIAQHASAHLRNHCRASIFINKDVFLLFDKRDPQEFLLDMLSQYKGKTCSCDLSKIFKAQDEIYVDMYLYNLQYFNLGYGIVHPSHQHVLDAGKNHMLVDNIFYPKDRRKGTKSMYHRSEMLKSYFYSNEHKDCLREILKSGGKHPFLCTNK